MVWCSWTGLTSQQVKYSYAEGGGEASAEAGTKPSQGCQHHQTQGHQWQQKLAPPQVYTHMHTDTETYESMGNTVTKSSFTHLLMHDRRSSPDWGQCIIQHHILVIINALHREEASSYSFIISLRKGEMCCDWTYMCAACLLHCCGCLVLYTLEWTAEVEWSFDTLA